MNHWLQTKTYVCPRCTETYLHDKAYAHDLFQCLHRKQAPTHTHKELR